MARMLILILILILILMRILVLIIILVPIIVPDTSTQHGSHAGSVCLLCFYQHVPGATHLNSDKKEPSTCASFSKVPAASTRGMQHQHMPDTNNDTNTNTNANTSTNNSISANNSA